jgi:hypothetical protein
MAKILLSLKTKRSKVIFDKYKQTRFKAISTLVVTTYRTILEIVANEKI